jgi:hypothetical protein
LLCKHYLETNIMPYLDPTEYVAYGLSEETPDAWIAMASTLMEAHCRRPSLLVTQYVERMRITANSPAVRLSYFPLNPLPPATSPLVAARVRYGRPRRGELQTGGPWDGPDPMLSLVAWAFSIPGTWSALDPTTLDVNLSTGEVTIPLNLLGIYYNELEITYTAGLVTAPPSIKFACAQIVKNAQAIPAMNVKSSRLDTLEMQYFSGSLVDTNVQAMLAPYVAQRIG